MKIGIGVTTYNRPEHLKNWLEQTGKYIGAKYEPLVVNSECEVGYLATENHSTEVFVVDDSQVRRGVAYRKNELLKKLKDNDYIFLFDDDCFPIKEGWIDFFISAHKASGQHHFLYLKQTSTIKLVAGVTGSPDIFIYDNAAGCFMFLTKEVIEKVGVYNPEYKVYGYEHAGYSNRIHMAGLTPMGKYLCPSGVSNYIYAMDYDFHLPFNKKLKHEPSLKNELHLLESYLKENKKVYDNDFQIYQPLQSTKY